MRIEFTIPGTPLGKQRARSTASGRPYTPTQTREAEKEIAVIAKRAMHNATPATGWVRLYITARRPMPKAWTKGRKEWSAATYCTVKPDWDNIGKLVSDALNGICYRDDAQVASATVEKRWGEAGRADVTVEWDR